MKMITASNNQTERAPQSAACWPECVEDSYEQLVAAITALVAGDGANDLGVKATSNHFAL